VSSAAREAEPETRGSNLADALSTPIAALSPSGFTRWCNVAWARLALAPGEACSSSRPFSSFFAPANRDDVERWVEAALASDEEGMPPLEAELGGELSASRPVRLEARWHRLPGGIPHELVITATDIAQYRYQLESLSSEMSSLAARLESQEWLSDLSPAGLALIDEQGRVVRVNATMARFVGYPAADQIGRRVAELLPGMARALEPLLHRVQQRRIAASENCLRGTTSASNGEERVWRATAYPLPNSDGTLCSIGLVVEDITGENRLSVAGEESLDREQQTRKLESLDVLAGGIAHDFSNLLTGVVGNMDLATMELPAGSPARMYLRQAQTVALRAAELTSQLVAYTGKGRCVPRPLHLSRLVQEARGNLEVMVYSTGTLNCRLAQELPLIEADPAQLRVMLTNLVINAAEAIENRHGIITISTGHLVVDRRYLADAVLGDRSEPGPYAYLEVSDTGRGIDANTLYRLFDPFFTTKLMGRGLGLAAVLGIARSHRGVIKVASERGRGAEFRILFPCIGGSPGRQITQTDE